MNVLEQFNDLKKILADLKGLKRDINGDNTNLDNSSVSIIGSLGKREVSIKLPSSQLYLNNALRGPHAKRIVNDAIDLCQSDVDSMAAAAKAEYKRLFDEDFQG